MLAVAPRPLEVHAISFPWEDEGPLNLAPSSSAQPGWELWAQASGPPCALCYLQFQGPFLEQKSTQVERRHVSLGYYSTGSGVYPFIGNKLLTFKPVIWVLFTVAQTNWQCGPFFTFGVFSTNPFSFIAVLVPDVPANCESN